MARIEAKAFDNPDERVEFDLGHSHLVTVGSLTFGRTVNEPGWRWSDHVKPIAGTEWCEFHHVGYMLRGRLHVITSRGDARDVVAGEVFDILPGHDAWVVGDEPVVEIDFQGAIGWAKPREPGERVLTTILFTDIVESTATAERLGDWAWKQLLNAHEEDVRSLLEQFHGREVETTGDGFLATFDAPAHAVECALAIARAARRLEIEIRAGVHTGEVEIVDGDLHGVAVHTAARIMAAAAPGTVWVSSTSRELATGIPITFVDRGHHRLKGISETRQLFEAQHRANREGARSTDAQG